MKVLAVANARIAPLATQDEQLAVHGKGSRARALVQIVHVLADQGERGPCGDELRLERRQGMVPCVGLCGKEACPPKLVEAPDQGRIALPGLRRGDVIDAVVLPQTSSIAEGGQARFCRNPRAGQRDESARSQTGHACMAGALQGRWVRPFGELPRFS